MRLLVTVVVLGAILLAGGLLYRMSKESGQEAQVAGWAHSLVWEALGLQVTPEFSNSVARMDPADSQRWVVVGDVEAQGRPELEYVAGLRMTCGDARSRECWRLEDLFVGELSLVSEGMGDPRALAALWTEAERRQQAAVVTQEPASVAPEPEPSAAGAGGATLDEAPAGTGAAATSEDADSVADSTTELPLVVSSDVPEEAAAASDAADPSNTTASNTAVPAPADNGLASSGEAVPDDWFNTGSTTYLGADPEQVADAEPSDVDAGDVDAGDAEANEESASDARPVLNPPLPRGRPSGLAN